tara:strand:+ start:231 stop:452 length:222 start_codon:yes stop_codon:yes gene_type:complete
MDEQFKAKRYAMIRRAAMKVQQRQQSQRRQMMMKKKADKAIEVLDDQTEMHWPDTDRYLDAHYGENFKGENNG